MVTLVENFWPGLVGAEWAPTNLVAPTKWGLRSRGSENIGIRLLYWSHTANRVPVVLIVVTRTRIHVATVEAQVVRVRAVGITVRSRRPIVAVAATIARRRIVPVAGIDEVIWERAPVFGGLS